MHEVSLVVSLIDQIEDLSKKENFTKVQSLRLSIGAFSGVNAEAIEFCFSEVVKGSLLEGAELTIEKIPLKIHCQKCLKNSILEEIWDLSCPHCLASDVVILTGKEFRIVDCSVYNPTIA